MEEACHVSAEECSSSSRMQETASQAAVQGWAGEVGASLLAGPESPHLPLGGFLGYHSDREGQQCRGDTVLLPARFRQCDSEVWTLVPPGADAATILEPPLNVLPALSPWRVIRQMSANTNFRYFQKDALQLEYSNHQGQTVPSTWQCPPFPDSTRAPRPCTKYMFSKVL